ncbi:hypothetical protein XF24_01022 [candidate division SR1 bacterium Aalborg_AAW-1]|nr:hypothetical protein XF24_01022 [candidate division SR1 bacterium Aalborg_AAW-1]
MDQEKYYILLFQAMIRLRHHIKDIDQESYEILDIIHNIPLLLLEKKEIWENIIIDQLYNYEKKYHDKKPIYSHLFQKK